MKKTHSPEFKAQIVLEILKEERTVTQVASEHGIHPTQLHRWKNMAVGGLPKLFTDENKKEQALKAESEKKLQELYAEIGRLNTQLSWLKKKGIRVD